VQLDKMRADEAGAPRDEGLASFCHAAEPIEGL
jgi:hypothetical protein